MTSTQSGRAHKPGAAAVIGLLVASYLLINLILGLHRWLPNPGLFRMLAPTVESAVVLAALVLLSRLKEDRARVWLVVLAVLTTVIAIWGIGEAFYRTIFRQSFVPWTDLAFLPALLNMVSGTELFSLWFVLAIPVVLLVALVTFLVYLAFRGMNQVLGDLGPHTYIASVVILAGLSVPNMLSPSVPLSVRLVRNALPAGSNDVVLEEQLAEVRDRNRATATDRGSQYELPGIRDRDVHLMIVESYGHTLHTNPAHRPLFYPSAIEFDKTLRGAGYLVVSHFLESPAFGGRSWLADASILTGVFLDTQARYEAILDEDVRNLSHKMGDAGYHRIFAAPGSYFTTRRWRDFYRYDEYFLREDFGYQGRVISFGNMPDQYMLYRMHQHKEQLVASGMRPMFLNYILVSSHVPFYRVPTYVEDWDRLGDGSIYNDIPIRFFANNWISGGEYPEGYVTSIDYVLRTVTDYITRIIDEDDIYIIVGDHQPRQPISEDDASFSVPIHVITRDREIADAFRFYGFEYGLWTEQPLPHPGMDEFLPMFDEIASGQTAGMMLFAR